ncbi:hypothetical protein JCM30471_34250 [Desulfuromonas carbonis]|uniref:gamma-glutamylcyclotransferase family protein n=1 Tax=Desulfuromonas sp. DDH964 TaxID=1823759 RepID=UPI00078CDC28|nr:gamma-glutamylcyclotransferase family protein [Desulfuromonas sp. DDH964]AMV71908.1 hypothetical protein DBW_1546 [Desulfuromonas sp. DDH964]
MPTLHYLAYGSNMHPLRLRERCPSALPLGVVELPGMVVRDAKRSEDGSGKCTFINQPGHLAFGVLYAMDALEQPLLDRAEGLGQGYDVRPFRVSLAGVVYSPIAYVVRPSHFDLSLRPYDWYQAMVVGGARHMGMPEEYIAELDAVEAIIDLDAVRRENERARLRRMGCLR